MGANYTTYIPQGASFIVTQGMAYPGYVGSAPSAIYSQKVSGKIKVSAKFVISGTTAYTGLGYIIVRSIVSDFISTAITCGYNNNSFVINKVENGVETVLATAPLGNLATGVNDTITATLDGTTLITCAVAGTNNVTITVNAPAISADGYAGIAGGSSAGNFLFIDDFYIQKY